MEALSNSRIEAAYRERTRRSAELAREARDLFPSGITHDSRKIDPYTIYVDRAEGPRKWDVDGNEYIDYFGGHGALMLGHHHPDIDRVIVEALGRGTHFGSSHEGEVRWAQAIKDLVPSVERVRFTSSGTEATHLALRVARAATGRRKVVRFRTHFHGWHDHMTQGYVSHFDGTATPGVLEEVAGSVVLLDPGDEAAMRETMAGDPDIAAAILEPTGSTFGLVPLRPSFLEALREATQKNGVMLIFDEVVTGSGYRRAARRARSASPPTSPRSRRSSPAVCRVAPSRVGRTCSTSSTSRRPLRMDARRSITRARTTRIRYRRRAGTEMLRIVGSTDACAHANDFGERLRAALNEVLVDEDVPWAAYGTFSGFHVFLNPEGRDIRPDRFDPFSIDYRELKGNPPGL